VHFPRLSFENIIIPMASPTKFPSSAATERIQSLANHLKDSLNPADDLQKAKMTTDYTFKGWIGVDKHSADGKMVWKEFTPKSWTEKDVDIRVTHCGICASDLHTLRSGWVSHEIFSLAGVTDDISRVPLFIHAV
jgi:alcohol dehydrogenase (NADP+)